MSKDAFYLKYRPQSLNDLIGQEAVKTNLLSAFQNNKLSHAYLLVGPRGTGKTSTARILAKMVNCEEKNAPCNTCATCLSITDGSNLDLIEIDAASNRGIEDIRVLRERIKLAPTACKKKVYIIDEVHMLTQEAFNALLKTLEEPPDHALFILATTEGSKIPQTILSRVQRLDFHLAGSQELSLVLSKITKAEKIDIDEEALKDLVIRADGSFRDGVKLLDQISSFKGKITAKVLAENQKSAHFDNLVELLQNLIQHDARAGLLNISQQIKEGRDAKELTLSLMDILRNMMFIKNGLGEQLVKPNLTEDKYEKLLKISESFSNQDLVADLEILQKALEQLKFAVIPSLPLELAVVEICGDSSAPVIARSEVTKQSIPESEPIKIAALPAVARNDDGDNSDSPDILKIKEKWTFVLETIRPYNFSLEALLRSTTIAQCTDSEVIMEVPYSFHQRILEAPKNRDILEGVLSDILGRSIRVIAVLGNRPAKREDVANIEMAADDDIIRAAAEIFNSDTVN